LAGDVAFGKQLAFGGQCVLGKAAEGRRTPERWREIHLSREREASWSAPVPWRFPLTNPYRQIRRW